MGRTCSFTSSGGLRLGCPPTLSGQVLVCADLLGLSPHTPRFARQYLTLGPQIRDAFASYRQDVGDTRYSGSEVVVRRLTEMGAEVRVNDPYVEHWFEFESQDTYPAPGHSLARFFRNQEGLKDLRVEPSIAKALKGVEALVLAVPHEPYLELTPEKVVKMAGGPIAIVDCFGILSDDDIRRYFELGCEVKGLGRGHIQRIKAEVRA